MTVRAPIFAAIKAARGGKAFAAMEVPQVDDLLDRLGVPRDDATAPFSASRAQLGALSERYESGGRGPGTVSTGAGDPGGVSYGLYQLATKTGTPAAFVAREGSPWSSDFAGLTPGTPKFSAAWKAVAARDPERFSAAQHAFIERTHYLPVVAKVLESTGLDVDKRAQAVRDAVWSCAVQHGKAALIISDAVKAADATGPRNLGSYDRALVEAIYKRRTDYVRSLLADASGGTAKTFRTLIDDRYPDERRRALDMLP